jgi:phosphoglycerate dehydrogenase-like enzyme
VLPGGVETQGLLTYELLSKLPANSYVYNVGRGNVYEEQDLVAILQADKIAGVYLDVFDAEPLSEKSLLWQLDNVLIQPHISAASPQYLELFVEELAEKINNLKEN